MKQPSVLLMQERVGGAVGSARRGRVDDFYYTQGDLTKSYSNQSLEIQIRQDSFFVGYMF